jgi:hypothetical protein
MTILFKKKEQKNTNSKKKNKSFKKEHLIFEIFGAQKKEQIFKKRTVCE